MSTIKHAGSFGDSEAVTANESAAAHDCPKCGSILQCLGGCSAHSANWYCSNTACGWQAWNAHTQEKSMWAEHCSAVRGVKGGTNEPSEYRWCSPCGQLLKDTDPCFKLPAAQEAGKEPGRAISDIPASAADPRVTLSAEQIREYFQYPESATNKPNPETVRRYMCDQALAALDLQTKLANLDWWCDTCNQRYSGPSDEQCSRASCPRCGHWMVNYQERRNEKAEAELAASRKKAEDLTSIVNALSRDNVTFQADLAAARELLSIHNLGGMTDYNDGPMKRALKAEADLAAARTLAGLEKIEREALEVKLAEAQKDAERYRHCDAFGFPVRNQTASKSDVAWIAFGGAMHINYGATPTQALDAAIAAAKERA